MRGWKPTDNDYRKTHDRLLRIWHGLKQRADYNKDDQVCLFFFSKNFILN